MQELKKEVMNHLREVQQEIQLKADGCKDKFGGEVVVKKATLEQWALSLRQDVTLTLNQKLSFFDVDIVWNNAVSKVGSFRNTHQNFKNISTEFSEQAKFRGFSDAEIKEQIDMMYSSTASFMED